MRGLRLQIIDTHTTGMLKYLAKELLGRIDPAWGESN